MKGVVMRPPYSFPTTGYRSGTLSCTAPRSEVVHMWCDVDREFQSPSSSSISFTEDWVVCKAVGFLFDKEQPDQLKSFCDRIKRDLFSVGPGLFNVRHGLDADRLPSVECLAHPDFRWLVWTNHDAHDGIHEWMLWREEDVRGSRVAHPPLQAGPLKA